MRVLHEVIGYAIVSAFGLLPLWGLTVRLIRRGPGQAFWWLVAGVQVAVGIQLIAGIVLLALGGSQPLLHYFYGSLFPMIVLVVAHVVARGLERDQWVPFAWAGFFCFGLTARALLIGLGIG